MLTAKEAREKLDKVILEEKMEEVRYITRAIDEAIKEKANWTQVIDIGNVPEDHIDFVKSLGYAVEYIQAIKIDSYTDIEGNLVETQRPMKKWDCKGPYYYAKEGSDPLMCWKISW